MQVNNYVPSRKNDTCRSTWAGEARQEDVLGQEQ